MKEDRNGTFILLDENPNKYRFQGKSGIVQKFKI
jgi:hypothetical protein